MEKVSLAPPPRLSREEALSRVREWIPGVERVLCIQSTPRQYVLALEGGQKVDIGSVENLMSQRKVRARVAEVLKVLPRWLDQRYWDDMAQAIMDASEDVEAPEAEELDLLLAWLEAYLDERSPAREDDPQAWESHFRMELPLYWRGDLAINATNFAAWVGDRRGHRIRPREMALLLRRYGAEPVKIQRWKGSGANRTRRYWAIPASLLPPEWVPSEGEAGEVSDNAFSSSQITGSVEPSDYARNALQNGESEGSSHIVREVNPPDNSQPSDYVTREATKPVQNGAPGLVRYLQASDYVTRTPEKDFSTGEEGEVLSDEGIDWF